MLRRCYGGVTAAKESLCGSATVAKESLCGSVTAVLRQCYASKGQETPEDGSRRGRIYSVKLDP